MRASQHSAHLGPAARQQPTVQVGRPEGLEPGGQVGLGLVLEEV